MHPSAPSGSSDLRYPIGRMPQPALVAVLDEGARRDAIRDIAALPARLGAAVQGLTPEQLDTPYREGGWTLRQVVHHIADSHINAYIRLRLAITEEWPTIRPYEEALWAELPDARALPVETSLALLTALHARWIALLEFLPQREWQRGYVHPALGRTTVDAMTAIYSWHSRHHTAHVQGLRVRQGW